MASQPTQSTDYGSTVSAESYVSGIMNHIWIAPMYEVMGQQTKAEIDRRLGKNPGKKVLVYDLGCGPGHFTNALAARVFDELGHYGAVRTMIHGFDISQSFIEYANTKKRRLHPVACNLVQFSERDVRAFRSMSRPADIITTSGFFHHFPPEERGALLKKVTSLLAEGGVLIDGDEHPASQEWFEKHFPTYGRQLSILALYLQVIDGARKVHHQELIEAEIENCYSEMFRNAVRVPTVQREELIELFVQHAEEFMQLLISDGLEVACQIGIALLGFLRSTMVMNTGAPSLTDRGDFKEPADSYAALFDEHGLALSKSYDLGQNEQLGSAVVMVFHKK